MWPGFGDNARVLDWIIKRVENAEGSAVSTPVGMMPTKEALNLNGIEGEANFEQLFSIEKDFWTKEVAEIEKYFDDQLSGELPARIRSQLEGLKQRVSQL